MIRMERISKVYGEARVRVAALHGIDLQVKEGGFVSIMGPSGSGKSTLMNIMGCLDRPTSGSYFLAGEDVAKLDSDELAKIRNRHIGFVFQSFYLLPGFSAKENVELPMMYAGVKKKVREKRAEELLYMVGLKDRVNHMPGELSGGQRQRVAIARALANSPRLLLADEPTGNLDSKNSFEIMRLIKELNDGGVTVVLITHEKEIAECAKEVLYIRDGRLSFGEKCV